MPDHPPASSQSRPFKRHLGNLQRLGPKLTTALGALLAVLAGHATGLATQLQGAWSQAAASFVTAGSSHPSPASASLSWNLSIAACVLWALWPAAAHRAGSLPGLRPFAIRTAIAVLGVLGLSILGQGFSGVQIQPAWPLLALTGGVVAYGARWGWLTWAADRRRQAQEASAAAFGKAGASSLAQITAELRVTVNAVLGVADLIAEEVAEGKNSRQLAVLHRAADSLSRTLDDVDELGRAQSGQLVLNLAELPLLPLIHEQVSQVRREAEGKGVQIQLTVAVDTPRSVKGDARRLAQVIAYMLNHSVRATRQGHIHLELRPHARDSRMLRFVVTDTSMSPMSSKLATLAAPFSEAIHERARHSTGIGLSLAARLAELMGGKLSVRHSSGRGSIMILTALLPRETAQPTAALRNANTGSVHQGAGLSEGALSAPRPHSSALSLSLADNGIRSVLLVDDNLSTRALIESMLDKNHFRVATCSNGREALNALEIAPYDIVLMDLHMPHMDGAAAVRQLRKQEAERRLRRTPVIALGDAPFSMERQRCLEAGFDDHMCKPVRKSRLLESIHALAASTAPVSTSAQAALGRPPLPNGSQRYVQRDALSHLAHDGVVDVNAAVEGLGGNASIYLDAIEQLTPALYNWPARFRDTLARGETERARQMALDMQSILEVVRATPCAAALGHLASVLNASTTEPGAQTQAVADLDRQMQALLLGLRHAVERLREGRNDLTEKQGKQNSAL
jgi:CheY-like chemotaxis protein